jgi:hypothetical protein
MTLAASNLDMSLGNLQSLTAFDFMKTGVQEYGCMATAKF